MAPMSSLCNYARAFDPKYRVSFVGAHPKGIIDDLVPAAFPKTASRAIYIRHVHVERVLMRNVMLLPLGRRLSKGPLNLSNLGITCLNSKNLLSTCNSDALCLLKAVDWTLRYLHMKDQYKLHATLFYLLGSSYLQELYVIYDSISRDEYAYFQDFMGLRYKRRESSGFLYRNSSTTI